MATLIGIFITLFSIAMIVFFFIAIKRWTDKLETMFFLQKIILSFLISIFFILAIIYNEDLIIPVIILTILFGIGMWSNYGNPIMDYHTHEEKNFSNIFFWIIIFLIGILIVMEWNIVF